MLSRGRPAMMEDADSDGNVIDGSYTYARLAHRPMPPPAVPSVPTKYQSNMGKKKKSERYRESTSPVSYDSDSSGFDGAPVRRSKSKAREPEKPKELERKPSIKKKKSGVLKDTSKRPSTRNGQAAPQPAPPTTHTSYSDESHGAPLRPTPMAARPRAQTGRPSSYYGQSPQAPPPASRPTYYPGHYQGHSPHQGMPFQYPPAPGPYGSYGQQGPSPAAYGHQWAQPPHMAQGHMGPNHMPPPPPSKPIDYTNIQGRNLADRFRPQSSMGFRETAPGRYGDHEPRQVEGTTDKRRPSVAKPKAQKEKVERPRRPSIVPPARPSSTRPERTAYMARHVGFNNDSEDSDSDNYHPKSARSARPPHIRQPSFEYGSAAIPPRSKRISYQSGAAEHELAPAPVESAPRQRRNSTHDTQAKIKKAHEYQEDVSGGPAPVVTAESLRPAASSRSSRSSASRDRSSHRHSATTRTTTRSGGSDEEITIKVPVGAVVNVHGTMIECKDGGELTIPRQQGTSSQRGSDRATTVYDDEAGDRRLLYHTTSHERGDDRGHHGIDHHNRTPRASSRPPPAPVSARPRAHSQAAYPRALTGQGYIPPAPVYPGANDHHAAAAYGYIPPPPQYPFNPHGMPDEDGGARLYQY